MPFGMTQPLDPAANPSPYRVRSPQTWDAARAAYLAGEAAEAVCARFDIGLTAFRVRARQEGWRRADQPDPEPLPLDDEDADDLAGADPATLAALAWRHLGRALSRGRSAEAQRWLRVHAQLTAPARATERAASQTADRLQQARRTGFYDGIEARVHGIQTVARAVGLGLDRRSNPETQPHDPHDPHPENSTPSHSLTRAERRRLARQPPLPPGPAP